MHINRKKQLSHLIQLRYFVDSDTHHSELDSSEKAKVEIEIEEENDDDLKEETNEEEPNKIVEDKPAAHLVGRDSV